jgi:hypothetical protein
MLNTKQIQDNTMINFNLVLMYPFFMVMSIEKNLKILNDFFKR